MRVNRDLLRHLPHPEFSEVGHAEMIYSDYSALPSFTRTKLRDAALK